MRRIAYKLLRILFVITVVSLLMLSFFRSRYHQTIRSLAQTQVINATSDLINDAIDRQIELGNIQYDRIVYFEKDLDGKITALKTNMIEVNRLKTAILNIINDEILEMDNARLGIPVDILSIRNSDAAFESFFTEAGINQTLQQLTMEISVDVSILVLGRSESFTVSSQVVVAETIIVGQVPDTFFDTGG